MRNARTFLATIFSTLYLAGCAAAVSHRISDPVAPPGLIYHLPLEAIKLSVKVDPEGITLTPDAEPGELYADPRTTFVLDARSNWLAKNEMNVTVSDVGLLGTISATHTNEAGKILGGLAALTDANFLSRHPILMKYDLDAAIPLVQTTEDECPKEPNRTYVRYIRFNVDDTTKANEKGFPFATICGFTFTIVSHERKYLVEKPAESDLKKKIDQQGSNRIFYRQKTSMLVEARKKDEATKKDAVWQFLLDIVDPAQIGSVEVRRTLFADNTSAFTFENGMLKTYNPKIESEVLAAVTLPATAVTAYLQAVGSIFGAFRTSASNESEYYKAIIGLQQQKLAYQSCIVALAQKPKDDAAIRAACVSN